MDSANNARCMHQSKFISLLLFTLLFWHSTSYSGGPLHSNGDYILQVPDAFGVTNEHNINNPKSGTHRIEGAFSQAKFSNFEDTSTPYKSTGNAISPSTRRLVNKVRRANFTHGIQNHEPVDAIVSISHSYEKMYFFTELVGLKGDVVKHRWEHDGQVKAEVMFDVASPRYRVYSSKNIEPDSLGTWTVTVTNEDGLTLAKTSIVVVR